jgi:hypothetical protein
MLLRYVPTDAKSFHVRKAFNGEDVRIIRATDGQVGTYDNKKGRHQNFHTIKLSHRYDSIVDILRSFAGVLSGGLRRLARLAGIRCAIAGKTRHRQTEPQVLRRRLGGNSWLRQSGRPK